MTLNILLSTTDGKTDKFLAPLEQAFQAQGLSVSLRTDHDPATVDYIVYAPNKGLKDFGPYTQTKAVLSLWAGVEGIADNPTLTQPLARMVDSGLRQGMVEWVCGHVLRHHLGMDAHINNPTQQWGNNVPPLAGNRRVGILGMGELGRACAIALSRLGFDVAGWSRRAKSIDGVECFDGDAGLVNVLRQTEILVLLLPLTDETENLIDAARLTLLPTGAKIINPGRGALIDDGALLDALDGGHIDHATLDVFRIEPLPADHVFWSHPNVTVTPHIASDTRAETAAMSVAENIRRNEDGKPMLHLVDRQTGY